MKHVQCSMFDVRRLKCPKPRTSNLEPRTSSQKGFTLIEMVVVILILSMAMMLVLPRLPSTDAADLKNAARSLSSTVRYLGDQSIARKTHYRLHLRMDENSVAIGKIGGGEETTADDLLTGPRKMPGTVVVRDVQVPRLGTVSEGEVIIDFGAGGLEEFLTIHLKGSRESHMTVIAFPRGGKVQVLEGYQEVKL